MGWGLLGSSPLLAAAMPAPWDLPSLILLKVVAFAAAGMLTLRMLRDHAPRERLAALAALAMFTFACLSQAALLFATQFAPGAEWACWARALSRLIPCSAMTLCAWGYLWRHDRHRGGWTIVVSAICAAAAVWLQWHYIIIPWEPQWHDAPAGLWALVRAHKLVSACTIAVVIPYSLRVMSLFDFTFLQGVMLFHISNFAILTDLGWRAQTPLWASVTSAFATVLMLIALSMAQHRGKRMFGPATMAPWRSMRCCLGAFACAVNIALLSGMVFSDTMVLPSIVHIVKVLWFLFACWSVSNWLALWVANDLRSLHRLMPQPASVSTAQDLQGLQISTVHREPLFSEIEDLVTSYNGLVNQANELLQGLLIRNRDAVMGTMAAQVAHDIRSPLSALHMALPELRCTSEEQRVLFRTAVFRIQDIATQLLEQQRALRDPAAGPPPDRVESVLISSLVETVVSEKRTQFRARLEIDIEHTMSIHSYGLFAQVCPSQLKRVIANLIDNAVEACDERGTIALNVAPKGDTVCITVRDEGRGMPEEILARLGEEGVTHGKVNGTGLGVHHATCMVRAWGGNLNFESTPEVGTRAVIELPKALAPNWFVERIVLDNIAQVVILDDDLSIHRIWSERFAEVRDVVFTHQSTPDELRRWRTQHPSLSNVVFLLDFELLGFDVTGLDLVEELGLRNRAILVTSRFEEPQVVQRCETLGVRLLPKPVAAYVPIIKRSATASAPAVDAVLIDDDPLVHMAWNMAAKRAGKRVAFFKAPREFLGRQAYVSADVPLYVDAQLGELVQGEEFARELLESGFTNVILATGRDPATFAHLPWITQVVGKEPPF